ncbi:hypothetical protein Asppvi_007183 [Aspergillus pseudoviridinutans]|uniref:Uncharacterized protein n=1 Tax=Aspergillus pseudoviridinutans TaxID=1517512 RepID=A0A9P3BDY6_9EURO|nr:uncharacterized protein Asppvi_007183 [Aspergillus pseudoviridinutans]GIJ88264.1 hypothetical protein Asppvi_007183 [Aspergillus pseudoviridinutans]
MDGDPKYSERETAWQNSANDFHPAVVITNSYKVARSGTGRSLIAPADLGRMVACVTAICGE